MTTPARLRAKRAELVPQLRLVPPVLLLAVWALDDATGPFLLCACRNRRAAAGAVLPPARCDVVSLRREPILAALPVADALLRLGVDLVRLSAASSRAELPEAGPHLPRRRPE